MSQQICFIFVYFPNKIQDRTSLASKYPLIVAAVIVAAVAAITILITIKTQAV
jgi:hypothetical protein